MNLKRAVSSLRDPEVLREDYQRVLRIARDYLEGRVGLLGAARAMHTVSFYIDAQTQPEFQLFTEIAENSWRLPIGSDRESSEYQGSDDQLKAEIAELEEKYGKKAVTAAESLITSCRILIGQIDAQRNHEGS